MILRFLNCLCDPAGIFQSSNRFCRSLAAFAVFVVCTAAQAAAPEVTSLYPAGVTRGQSVTVTATGKFDTWPTKIWVDRPGLEVKPAEKKGQLTVQAAADAIPGTYWIRCYDAEGSASLRPFVVGLLPEATDSEPNDDPAKPQKIKSSGVVINGKFNKSGDVDVFACTLVKGQVLVASMQANEPLGSVLDGVLQILDARGFVLAQNDDELGLDPQLAFAAPQDGEYLVRSFCFPAKPNSSVRFAGGDAYIYRLTITAGGFVDHAYPLAVSQTDSPSEKQTVTLQGWNLPEMAKKINLISSTDSQVGFGFLADCASLAQVTVEPHPTTIEQEPNDRVKEANTVSFPITISGRIEKPADKDVFRFAAKKGQRVQLSVESRHLGFALDPYLQITDDTGKVLRELDDLRPAMDVSFVQAIPADGYYQVVVRDLHHHGGFRYPYRLRIEIAEPNFSLSVASDHLTLSPDKPLETTVTVNRIERYAGEIEISATQLPPGVTCEAVKSLSKGATAKSVKLVFKSDGTTFSGPIQIVGTSTVPLPKAAKSNPANTDVPATTFTRIASGTIAATTAKTTDLWLTITAKAEKK